MWNATYELEDSSRRRIPSANVYDKLVLNEVKSAISRRDATNSLAKYLTVEKFKTTLGEAARNGPRESPLENNPGTLPNPLSRSFRAIGARNNFPATTSGLRRHSIHTYTLSNRSAKAKLRVHAIPRFALSGETGRRSLPTFSTALAENFLVEAIPIHITTSSSQF